MKFLFYDILRDRDHAVAGAFPEVRRPGLSLDVGIFWKYIIRQHNPNLRLVVTIGK